MLTISVEECYIQKKTHISFEVETDQCGMRFVVSSGLSRVRILQPTNVDNLVVLQSWTVYTALK